MKLFFLMTILLLPSFCWAAISGVIEIYDPLNKPFVKMESKDGKTIAAQILQFDDKRGLVQIRIKANGRSMWFSPDLLNEASRAELEDWRMIYTINEFVTIKAKRSNKHSAPGSTSKNTTQSKESTQSSTTTWAPPRTTGFTYTDEEANTTKTTSGARYDIELRNFSKVDIKDIEIRAITLVKSSDGKMNPYKCRKHVEALLGTQSVLVQTDAAKIVSTKTNSESTNKSYNSDGTYYVTGGSSSVKSQRDDLKGLAIRLYYKGTVVQEWYSARTVEEEVKW